MRVKSDFLIGCQYLKEDGISIPSLIQSDAARLIKYTTGLMTLCGLVSVVAAAYFNYPYSKRIAFTIISTAFWAASSWVGNKYEKQAKKMLQMMDPANTFPRSAFIFQFLKIAEECKNIPEIEEICLFIDKVFSRLHITNTSHSFDQSTNEHIFEIRLCSPTIMIGFLFLFDHLIFIPKNIEVRIHQTGHVKFFSDERYMGEEGQWPVTSLGQWSFTFDKSNELFQIIVPTSKGNFEYKLTMNQLDPDIPV